ncbi:MAG TPA: DUF5666 domain-containing protein, partial [Chloroflexota bacterium]
LFSNIWRRHFNLLVVAVVILGLFAGAGLAGVTRQAPPAVVQSSSNQGGAAAGGPSEQGTAGATQAGGISAGTDRSARPVAGSVASVDGDSLHMTTQQGDATVKLAGAKISKVVDGSATDLSKGVNVTVMAQQQKDGSYTATSVQINPGEQAGGSAAIQSGGGGGRNQGQAQQGSDARARPMVGTVSALDGGVITVTTQQGDTKVSLGSARIQKVVDGSAKDLQSGQRVLVTGQAAQDGSYQNAQVEILANADVGSQGTPGAGASKVK